MDPPNTTTGYGPSSVPRSAIFAGDVSSFLMFKLRFKALQRTKGHLDVLDMKIEAYRAKVEDARTRQQAEEAKKLNTASGVIANDLFERLSASVLSELMKLLGDQVSDGLELWHLLCTKYSPSEDIVLEEGLFENIALKIISSARWHSGRGTLSVFVQGLCEQLDKLKRVKKATDHGLSFDVVQSLVLRAVLESVKGAIQYQHVHSTFYSRQIKSEDFESVTLAAFLVEVRAVDAAAEMSARGAPQAGAKPAKSKAWRDRGRGRGGKPHGGGGGGGPARRCSPPDPSGWAGQRRSSSARPGLGL